MKTKTIVITVIALLLVIIIGAAIFSKKEVPAQVPADATTAQDAATADGAKATTGTRANGSSTIRLTGGLHGTTTTLVLGQHIIITANNPVDAGYVIDPLQYDATKLTLVSHTHGAGTNDNGSETWEFSAMKSGTTGLTITTSQAGPSKNTVTLFSGAISIK